MPNLITTEFDSYLETEKRLNSACEDYQLAVDLEDDVEVSRLGRFIDILDKQMHKQAVIAAQVCKMSVDEFIGRLNGYSETKSKSK